MRMEGQIVFKDWECSCEHAPHVHDDGFGCTVEDCQCLAGWGFA